MRARRPLQVVRHLSVFTKAHYGGLDENTVRTLATFALSNLYLVRRRASFRTRPAQKETAGRTGERRLPCLLRRQIQVNHRLTLLPIRRRVHLMQRRCALTPHQGGIPNEDVSHRRHSG
jgi:hypothetical protein